MLSKKDLILLNKEFHTGTVTNAGSLDFAIEQARKARDWLRAITYLVRAVALDHVFEDGNKRTAAGIIMTCMDIKNIDFDKKKVDEVVITLAKKNIRDLQKIERLIKHVQK